MTAGEDFIGTFVLDGVTRYSRWHQEADAADAVVVHPSGGWAFRSVDGLRAAWPDWQPAADADESQVIDIDVVRAWLAGQVLAVPHEAVLGAWDFAGDTARGLGLPWNDRGRLRDRVYSKLAAAGLAVPLGHPVWTPRWSAVERRVLVDMGQSALRLLRTAVQAHRE